MVDDLEYFFCHIRMKSMINAGHSVQKDHGSTIDRCPYNAPGIAVDHCKDHAKYQRRNRQRSPYNVGNHVKYLFAFRIRRQHSIF